LSRLSRCAFAGSVLVALSTRISVASAAELVDPSSGFQMTLDLPGAIPCVIVPKGNDAAGCKGVDVDAKASAFLKAASKDATFAMVRFPPGAQDAWGTGVSTSSAAGSLGTADSMEAFVKAIEDRTAALTGAHPRAHGSGSAHFDVMKVGGLDAIRYEIDLAAAPGNALYGSARRLFYSIAGDGVVATVVFVSDPPHSAELNAAAAQMVKTVRMLPSRGSARGGSMAEQVGKLVGFMLFPVLGLGLFVAFLSKKKAGPPAQPPNQWPR